MKRTYKSIKDLYHNTPLFTAAMSLIHKGISYRKIQKYLHGQKFDMSLASIQRLVKKAKYSEQHHIPLPYILDKREYNKHKKSITDVAKAGRLKINGSETPDQKIVKSSLQQAKAKTDKVMILPRNHFYSDREVLDMQIDAYRNELLAHDVDKNDQQAGLTAIKLEERYRNNDPLSLEAIKQYELINTAHDAAVAQVAESMMPKKMYKEWMQRVRSVEKGIMKNTQITSDGKRLYNAFKSGGLDI